MNFFTNGRSSSSGQKKSPSFGQYDDSLFSNNSLDITSRPLSNDSLDSFSSSFSAFRILYNPDFDPYTPYNNFRCIITTLGQSRYFIGLFDTDTGDIVPVIQIPFIGQTIKSLSERLSEIPGISVQLLNDWDLSDTDMLLDSSYINATNLWGYFFVGNESVKNKKESNLDQKIQSYYTSLEPIMVQNNSSQSIGGFCSSNSIFKQSVLVSDLSFYDKYMVLSDDTLKESNFIIINDEIIEIEKWDGNKVYIKNRNVYDTPIRFHMAGSVVCECVKNSLFNNKFSEDRYQYRCIAIKNTSEEEVAKDVYVYFKIDSRNDLAQYKIAIEIPKSEYYEGSSQDGTRQYFIDSDLIESFSDEYFTNAALTFLSGSNSGQTRIISSFIKKSGKIVLDYELPYEIKKGDTYKIDPSPSQRLKTGTESPLTGSSANLSGRNVSDFTDVLYDNNAISINVNGLREDGGNLLPNQLIYVWIQRYLEDINEGMSNNRIMISVNYNRI